MGWVDYTVCVFDLEDGVYYGQWMKVRKDTPGINRSDDSMLVQQAKMLIQKMICFTPSERCKIDEVCVQINKFFGEYIYILQTIEAHNYKQVVMWYKIRDAVTEK